MGTGGVGLGALPWSCIGATPELKREMGKAIE